MKGEAPEGVSPFAPLDHVHTESPRSARSNAMIRLKQTKTFRRWEQQLKDQRARALIAARLLRLANGLVGDAVPVGAGVSEL